MKLAWLTILIMACGGGGGDDLLLDGGGEPDGPASGSKTGSLLIQELDIFGTKVTLEGGSFRDGIPTGTTNRTDGPCTIQLGMQSSPPAVSAGTLTLTSGSDVITIMPDADNEYFASQQELHYAPGVAIELAGSGAAVPAFSQSITFPGAITVTDPPASFLFMLSKSGFSATWTGTAPVLVLISQSSVLIRCRFDGVTSATLPASTLSDLAVTTGDDPDTSIVIGSISQEAFTAGAFDVDVQAIGAGFSTMGTVQP